MLPRVEHAWDLTPRQAAAFQSTLATQVRSDGGPGHVGLIGGVDVAAGSRFNRGPGRGAVVVLSYPAMQAVEQSVIRKAVEFPYVPGLLAFREIPVLLPAFAGLQNVPDLLIVDGQGCAHPRRMGLACHLGLLFDIPTIGCAKSKLIGEHEPLGEQRGSVAFLRDKKDEDAIIGAVVRTRERTKPIYVSVGHRISLNEAIDWTLRLSPQFRVPMPTRLAHQAAAGDDVVSPAKRTHSRGG
jgi:deoxyribonuclease V